METEKASDKKLKPFLIAIFISLPLILIAVGVCSFPRHVRHRVYSTLPREAKDFLENPVEIESRWLEAPPFSQELLSAVDAVRAEWGMFYPLPDYMDAELRLNIETISERKVLSDHEWNTVRQVIRMAQPLLNSVKRLTSLPDYEYSALEAALGPEFNAYSIAPYMRLKADLLAHEGKWSEGFDANFRTIELCQRSQFTPINHHFAADLLWIKQGCLQTDRLLKECNDVPALRMTLVEFLELPQNANPKPVQDSYFLGTVGDLIYLRRLGYSIDTRQIQQCPSGLELMGLTIRTGQKLFGAECWGFSGRHGANLIYASVPFEWLRNLALGSVYALDLEPATDDLELTFWLASMPRSDMHSRSAASLDCTRLNLAARIFELESGRPPDADSDLVPDLIPEFPKDPISDEPYSWDVESKTFWSPTTRLP